MQIGYVTFNTEEWQQYGYSEMVPFWCLPRQEELLELLKGKITPEDMHKLLIDLSPYNKNNGTE